MSRTPPGAGVDGVICFAGVDWWYHNRGHSECQIMRRLAGETTVLWINSLGMRTPAPGRTELPFLRYWRKLRSTLKGLRRDACGMWVYSPLFVPLYSPRIQRLNGLLLRLQLAGLRRWLGLRRPAVWVTIPTAADVALALAAHPVVFNRSDEFESFPEVDGPVIGALTRRLLEAADVVVYVNRRLYEREKSIVKRAAWLDHGVDFEHFARARPGAAPPEAAPAALARLERPIVGFYGALDDYTVDLDLLIRVARSQSCGTLLVIGPKAMEIERLLSEPRVVYLGPIAYEELPAHAAHFDVGIMPWLQNEWIESCNPIKLKEYLALGFPVVSTPFPELEPYADLVATTSDPEEFVALVAKAARSRDPEAVAARRAAVRGASWDRVARRAAGLLGLSAGEEPCAE